MTLREQKMYYSTQANRDVRMIEFVGFPGSGKTTVANALICELVKNERTIHTHIDLGFTKYRRWKKLHTMRIFAPDVWLFIVYLGTYYFCYCYHQPLQQFRRLSLVLFYYNLLRNYRSENDDSILVLEHGMVNYLWLIHIYGRGSNNGMRRILRHIYKHLGIAYIYVDVSPYLAARRIEQGVERMRTAFDNNDYETNLTLFSKHWNDFGELINILRDLGSSLLVVNGELSVAEKTRIITSWIQGASPT